MQAQAVETGPSASAPNWAPAVQRLRVIWGGRSRVRLQEAVERRVNRLSFQKARHGIEDCVGLLHHCCPHHTCALLWSHWGLEDVSSIHTLSHARFPRRQGLSSCSEALLEQLCSQALRWGAGVGREVSGPSLPLAQSHSQCGVTNPRADSPDSINRGSDRESQRPTQASALDSASRGLRQVLPGSHNLAWSPELGPPARQEA